MNPMTVMSSAVRRPGTRTVAIGNRLVGDGQPVFVVAEAGINHNGDIDLAKRLVRVAAHAGCDAVKGQKRTLEVVFDEAKLSQPRESPWGTTNRDVWNRLELPIKVHREIDDYARGFGLRWTASAWDEQSVDDVLSLQPEFLKIASASLTDDSLISAHRGHGVPIVLSTGMSTIAEIDHAVDVLGTDDLILLHCTSTYPSRPGELNLRMIPVLRERYGVPIGYSGHEIGIAASTAAVAMGACMVERHITVDRSLFGSNQAASLEPDELTDLVAAVRTVEAALGDGVKCVYDSEIPVRARLRRVG